MILSYRGIRHKVGQVALQVEQLPLTTDLQELWAHNVLWRIDILLTSQDSTDAGARNSIKQQTATVESQYSKNNGDLILYDPTGAISHHVLRNSECHGGVRIIDPPSYRDGTGVECATKRTISVVVGGIKPIPTSQLRSAYRSFEETLEFAPAGRKTGHLETLTTRSVKQTLRRFQTYRVVQRGSAVGLYKYPLIPRAIWPFALVDEEPLKTLGHPRRIGGALTDFPIAWEYQFQSNVRLLGQPHIWGLNA